MIRLGVNIDHVATVRQARRTYEPDPVAAASVCLLAGAEGITVHLREDRRHIQDRDLRLLRATVPFGLNLEMAVADEVVALALATKPDQVTLVPEKREELTTEGGLDVVGQFESVQRAVNRLLGAGIPVSMFVAPDAAQIDASKRLGAYAVELHTGRFAETWKPVDAGPDFPPLVEAARHASALGLRVHLGHGLNYHNVGVVCGIPKVEELNIGHAIVAKAVFVGLDRAVRDMKEAMSRARPNEGA